MPYRTAELIAARAAAYAQSFSSASALQVLDAAMSGHELTAPDFSAASAKFLELAYAASQDEALFIPRMPPLDFLRWRYGLRPDEPARHALEWRDRCALVLQSNCDAFPPGDPRVRDGLEDWVAVLWRAHRASQSPERVAMAIIQTQRAGRVQ